MGNRVKLVVEIDEDIRRELRIRALQQGTTVREILTRLIAEYLRAGRKRRPERGG